MGSARLRVAMMSFLTAVALAACVPGTNVERAPAFQASWNGPIEVVALVMSPPARGLEAIATSAYNLTSIEFLRHPYARQRFDVVDRAALDTVLQEIGLGQSGLVDASTAPRVGQLVGARYVILFDVINASVRPGRLGGIRLPGSDLNLGTGWADLDVTVAIRMVDVETGRVRANGSGRVVDTIITGFSIEGFDIGSPATRELVLDLVPEAAMRALNDLFRQIV